MVPANSESHFFWDTLYITKGWSFAPGAMCAICDADVPAIMTLCLWAVRVFTQGSTKSDIALLTAWLIDTQLSHRLTVPPNLIQVCASHVKIPSISIAEAPPQGKPQQGCSTSWLTTMLSSQPSTSAAQKRDTLPDHSHSCRTQVVSVNLGITCIHLKLSRTMRTNNKGLVKFSLLAAFADCVPFDS